MTPVRFTPICTLVLLASACSGSSTRSTAEPAATTPAPVATTQAPAPAATTPPPAPASSGPLVVAGQRINDGGTFDATNHPTVDVKAESFRFSPSVIIGKPGEKLTLVLTNPSSARHNIKAPAQHVDADFNPGHGATVHMTVPASGRLVFTCEYHAHAGMAGTVESPGTTAAPAASPAPVSTYS